jgi:hypothetical protein
LAPEGLDRLNPKLLQKLGGNCAQVMGVGVHTQRAIGAVQPSRASAERENEREVRDYRDGKGRRNRREREVWSKKNEKKVA